MRKIYLVALSILISSCAMQEGQMSRLDYLERGVRADIKDFFNGKMRGFAIVQDQRGDISDTVSLDVEASWEENKGVIKKTYKYANGEKDSRTWLVTLDNGGATFTAIGHDVASPAKGRKLGNAIQMTYSLLMPSQIRGQKEQVKFDDKYYLVDENSAIVISESSTGFGQVKKTIVSLRKLDEKKKTVAPRQLDEVEKEVEKTSYRSRSNGYKQAKIEEKSEPVREFVKKEEVRKSEATQSVSEVSAQEPSTVERAANISEVQVEEPNINEVVSSESN